ncbi:MAG: hypothetical protein LUQ38_03315 [Methanotrichaceae archaeon]|nr:hypothetical protein [Methanotrichaceae archaeon]
MTSAAHARRYITAGWATGRATGDAAELEADHSSIFRHSAIKVAPCDMHIGDVVSQLGHRSLQTTGRYIERRPNHRRASFEKMGVIISYNIILGYSSRPLEGELQLSTVIHARLVLKCHGLNIHFISSCLVPYRPLQ